MFPFGIYSKPLARKLSVQCSVAVCFLLDQNKIQYNKQDTIDALFNLGIETPNDVIRTLEHKKIISYIDGPFEVFSFNKEQIEHILTDDDLVIEGSRTRACMTAIRSWIAHLKNRNRNKSITQILVELHGKSDREIIDSIQYSKDNGYISLYFGDKGSDKKDGTGGRTFSAGEKTEGDKERDYSHLTKTTD